MAQSTPIKFSDLKLKIGAVLLGGLESTSLVPSQDLIEVTPATQDDWQHFIQGLRGWTIPFSGSYFESGEAVKGMGATLSFDGGTTALKCPRNFTLAGSANLIETTCMDAAGVRSYIPGRRGVTLNIGGVYIDPAATGAGALLALYNNVAEGGGVLDVDLGFGAGGAFTFDGHSSSLNIDRQNNDVILLQSQISATGPVVNASAGGDAAVAALFSAFFC